MKIRSRKARRLLLAYLIFEVLATGVALIGLSSRLPL